MSNKNETNNNSKSIFNKKKDAILVIFQRIDTNLDEYDAQAKKVLSVDDRKQVSILPFTRPEFDEKYISVRWSHTDQSGIHHMIKRDENTNKYNVENIIQLTQATPAEIKLFLRYVDEFSDLERSVEDTINSCDEELKCDLRNYFDGTRVF